MGLSITDILGGSVLSSVKDIIGQFHASPEDKLKMQAAIDEHASLLAEKQIEYDEKLNDIAGQNIRAETQSNDKFTSRARPMFMYIVEFILAFNYIGIPVARMFGSQVAVIDLPTNLLALFGVCVTGYQIARSMDKLMGLPGDSSIQLGSLKAGNKQ